MGSWEEELAQRKSDLEARVKGLPKWARAHIESLEDAIGQRDSTISALEARLTVSAEFSDTFAETTGIDVPQPLGRLTPIRFGRRKFSGFFVTPEADPDGRAGVQLNVRSQDGAIQIQPQVSNVVTIRAVGR